MAATATKISHAECRPGRRTKWTMVIINVMANTGRTKKMEQGIPASVMGITLYFGHEFS
jgi:hypothetical protein